MAQHRKKTNLRQNLQADLLLSPAAILLLVFVIFPFMLNLVISFTDYSIINPNAKYVGLANFQAVIANGTLVNVIKNTLIWAFGNLIPIFILGMGACLLMASDLKGLGFLKGVILLPWILPESVTGYTWKWMFTGDFGIIPKILMDLGLIDKSYSFLTSGSGAMLVVIMANVWRAFPFVAVMLYAKLKTMPADLMEAAQIDGASSVQSFFYIKLHWLMPIIKKTMMLTFIWTFNAFAVIYTITNGGPVGATETLPILLRRLAFRDYKFGQAGALGVIICAITLTILFVVTAFGKGVSRRERRLGQ